MSEWTWELEPSLKEIRRAAESLRGWLQARVDGARAADCELAMVEACNNLALHNPESRARIKISATVNPWQVTLTIVDGTAGFEWPANPQLPPPEAENGRGLALIHALMSAVEYRRLGGANELVLRRNLDPQGESARNDSGNG